MKQRLISAIGGLAILAVVLAFYNTAVLNVAISIIATIAVYEVLHAIQYLDNKPLTIVSLVFSACIPFFKMRMMLRLFPLISYVYLAVLFLLLLKNHKTMRVEQVGFTFFIALIIPLSLTTVIYMRDGKGMAFGLFYLLFALTAAWMADTGAYFAGRWFGKHKMSPEISPHKTVEGAIGGAIAALVSVVVLAWLAAATFPYFTGAHIQVNYLRMILCSPFLTLASIVGDLSASVIKRQCGVKDFGHIMPGHGGVMDRFDSVLFVVPAVYLLSHFLPLIVLLP